jgi:hypothetical protein
MKSLNTSLIKDGCTQYMEIKLMFMILLNKWQVGLESILMFRYKLSFQKLYNKMISISI